MFMDGVGAFHFPLQFKACKLKDNVALGARSEEAQDMDLSIAVHI